MPIAYRYAYVEAKAPKIDTYRSPYNSLSSSENITKSIAPKNIYSMVDVKVPFFKSIVCDGPFGKLDVL